MEVAGFVFGVLPMVVQTIDLCKRIKGARKSIQILLDELLSMRGNLEMLEQFLSSDAWKATNVSFPKASVLASCCTTCSLTLESLHGQLESANKGLFTGLRWLVNEKEHLETAQRLRNLGLWLHFALSMEGCKILSNTASVVSMTLSQQLDQFQDLQAAIDKQTRLMQAAQDEKHQKKILDWISSLDDNETYRNARSNRAQGTGDWFLQEIASWRNGMSTMNLLWCQGKVGSGKTCLTSLAIDVIAEGSFATSAPVAYFFFNHQKRTIQTPYAVVSSTLRQIVQALPETPKSIKDRYELCSNKGRGLSITDCEELLVEVLRLSPRNFIIIDALDECEGQEQLLEILDRLRLEKSTRLLLTSRDSCPLLNAQLLNIEASRYDIATYVKRELARSRLDPDFASQLESIIVERAQGMFLLPILHLKTVLNEPTLGDMKDKLASLPPSLSKAFDETIGRIKALPESRAQLGMSTLVWVARSRQTLKIHELCDALSLRKGSRVLNKDYRPDRVTILECCQGLVTVDKITEHVSLAHYSIQEYLNNNNNITLFPRAEAEMAALCLRYLLCENFQDGPCIDRESIDDRIYNHPFLAYASRNWGLHAQQAEDDAEVWALMSAYLQDVPRIASTNQIRRYSNYYRSRYWCVEESMSLTSLHDASQFGLKKAVKVILDSGQHQVDVVTAVVKTTPLIYAASNNEVEVIQLLLQHGADSSIKNRYGDALDCASEAGCCEAIRELTSYIIDPNDPRGGYRLMRPLSCTLDNDQLDAFKTLIKLGARIDIGKEVILHAAIRYGATRILTWLVKNGEVNVNCRLSVPGDHNMTTLHYAVSNQDFRTAQVLVQLGADVTLKDDLEETPYDYARRDGSKLLMDVVSLSSRNDKSIPDRTRGEEQVGKSSS